MPGCCSEDYSERGRRGHDYCLQERICSLSGTEPGNSISYGLLLIKYTSPTILIIGCGLLIIFSNIKCNKIIPLLRKTTPLVFSAYLLQDNKYIRKYFITDKFSFLATKNTFVMMLGVLFFAIICFVVGIIIDKVRLYLFKKIELKKRIQLIEENIFSRII